MTTCPVQSITPEVDSVWIGGKLYTVNRLPRGSFYDKREAKQTKTKKVSKRVKAK